MLKDVKVEVIGPDPLKRKYEIVHSVIQVECECCTETDERVCKR